MTTPIAIGASSNVVASSQPIGALPSATTLNASLLPAPATYSMDGIAELYAMFSASNREDTRAGKLSLDVKQKAQAAARLEQKAALERARLAQEQPTGFFDSMGIGSLVGIATANPALVIADMSMHMSRLTPEVLHKFELENRDTIELVTKVYCAVGNAEVIANGVVSNPETLRAAVALGGLLVQETDAFGQRTSDFAGAAMMVGGSRNSQAAAMVIVSDKDDAVADNIRTKERETRDYTKWIAIAGMAVAAGAAIVGSLGTAALPVVLIGVALSAGGFAVVETKALDPLLGKNASMWIGSGMMLSGAVITGAGTAAAAAEVSSALADASRVLAAGAAIVGGAAKTKQGLDQLETTAIQKEVADAHTDATQFLFRAQRLQRMADDVIDNMKSLKDSHQRVTATLNEALETQCQTQLVAASMKG